MGQVMIPTVKILYDVTVYRLRRLEMANLFGSLSIMLALHLKWDDVIIRIIFCYLLNVLIYLNNDYCNVEHDLRAPKKDGLKAAYLRSHMRTAFAVQIILFMLLVAIGLIWSYGLVVALVAGVGICSIYSCKLKQVPYADIIVAFFGGMGILMVSFPLDKALGWLLACQLALFAVCFQLVQTIRDYSEDSVLGVRTTAVQLGIPRAKIVLYVVEILAAGYAVLVLNRWFGLMMFGVLALSLGPKNVVGYWNRARMIMGSVWLMILAWIYWIGSSHGLLLSVDNSAIVNSLTWIR